MTCTFAATNYFEKCYFLFMVFHDIRGLPYLASGIKSGIR